MTYFYHLIRPLILLGVLVTLVAPLRAISADQEVEKVGVIVVVTSQKNTIEQVTKKELINLYMGKYAAFSNGKQATPIDIGKDEMLKAEFYQSLVGLPLARVNAYWSRLKFSGRAKPPSVEHKIEDVRARLDSDVSAVAYIYKSDVSDNMKVVYSFD